MQEHANGDQQAMSFGDTLSAIFNSFSLLFKPLLGAAIGFGLIVGISELIMRDDMIRVEQGLAPSGALWAGIVLMMLGSIYFWVVGYQRAHNLHETGQQADEFSTAWRCFFPVLAFLVLYGIAAALGMILLIIPGIFLSVLFILGDVQIALGRAGVISAFKESARLVWGNWWFTFGILLIIGVIVGIPYAIIDVGLDSLRYEGGMGEAIFAAGISVLLFTVVYPLSVSLFYTLLRSLESRQAR